METILHVYRPLALPALKAVIRKAAQKPVGTLTREDLLVLNALDVCFSIYNEDYEPLFDNK